MISCKKTTQLISKQMDEPLSIWEIIQLSTHIIFCWCCTRFKNHILSIREALREIAHETMAFERFEEIGMPDLSPQARQRVIKTIRDEQ
jgi:hypothetical protein